MIIFIYCATLILDDRDFISTQVDRTSQMLSRLPDALAVTPGPDERLQFDLCVARALKHMLISRCMNSPLRMPVCLKFGMHLSALLEQAPKSYWG